MFGLDQIAWTDFISLILVLLLCWYLGLMLILFFKSRQKQNQLHFEQEADDAPLSHSLQPIRVSAGDFPSEFIPAYPAGERVLTHSFYEDMGLDEGYSLHELEEGKMPLIPTI
ncbi:hypothetical protein [Marinifilum sp. D714]|uniref:hypothetical protein n=1 Tax=Marinifilum sp. D714 TaxID=2937523 RepID=UPI0027BE2451|nr:hypothetical protein [Marinifilum sp. D714]MDQ2178576.1 hypothetical protein [Marinifilum sp. D714]